MTTFQMPVMDGHAFIRAFNETEHAATTTVVALTANCDDVSRRPCGRFHGKENGVAHLTSPWVDQETRQRCLTAGFRHFLSKPLSIPKLTQVLEQVYADKVK
jgi:CheY-like chemotaxis protein